MINKIISFSLKNKFLVVLFTMALIGAGIHSMYTINLGSVPDITNNQVQVITVSPNLSTEDIEQFVTYPVELAMGNLPSLIEVRSISRFGLSVVTIVFEDAMGTYLPRQLVQEKLSALREEIPEAFGSPEMGPISTGLGQIYEYTIEPSKGYDSIYSPMDLRTIQDWLVKRQLTLLNGVVEINSFGGFVKQYEVAINPHKLKAMDIGISQVYDALANNNVNTGGAYIEKNHMANFIRGEGLIKSLEEIREIAISTESAIPLTIGDIAEVGYGHKVRYGAYTKDGKEAVGGMIMMLKGSNPNAVIQAVKERMAEVEKSLPEGLEIKTVLDRSNLISRTTSTVKTNLIEGALIVIFALVILLGSIRGGIITATTIPLSLLFAFILMKQFNVWANLMSLGAIDFGIIIDGAVIIIEGTVFEIQKRLRAGKIKFNQKEMDNISFEAGSTMMSSAFFGQVIILIVFTPILFLTGIEGKMFQPMAYTFGFAMIGAIILCLTYVPVMAAWFMKPSTKKTSALGKIESWLDALSNKIISKLLWVYQPILKKALAYKTIAIAISILLLAISGYLFSRMGGEFIPQLDEGDIAMQALLRPGSSLTESENSSFKIENLLLNKFPEIKTVTARIGVADIPTDPMPMDIADMYLILEKDKAKWVSAKSKDELIEKIRNELEINLTGINLVFTQPVELLFNELLEGVREDIAVKLYGEDLNVLSRKAQEIAGIIRTVPGAADVNAERISGLPQMSVKYDRKKIAQYGIDIAKLNQYINYAFAGGEAGVIFEGEKRFDLVLRFVKEHRNEIEDLRNMYVNLPNGEQVPLKELASIEYVPGPMQISRENTYRRTYVGVNARGRDVESIVNDIKEKIETQVDLPAGYYISYGGEFENLERAKSRLAIVVPIALFLIFVLLYFALQSITQSLMIYIAIPMAAIGGIFALWLLGMPFSISAGVGFIVLFGVAVLNGLVLINRFNSLKAEGVSSVMERVLIGTKERIRPIMLTATTDIFGFLPMALSTSAGGEVQRPLATVVIGGMLTATLLTLILLPVLYAMTEKLNYNRKISISATVKGLLVMLLFTGGGLFSSNSKAQGSTVSTAPLTSISLEEAKKRALDYFPEMKSASLSIENQKALKKTAWDLGNTQVFNGLEEAGNGEKGVYTPIGIQQQQIHPFGIAPKLKLQKKQIDLAEKSFELSKIDLELKVSLAWAEVFISKKNYEVYQKMDATFSDIERASRIQLETEAISKLEFLATSNQANEVKIQKQQAFHDYRTALQALNLWLGEDVKYTTPDVDLRDLEVPLNHVTEVLIDHPKLSVAREKVNVADAVVRERKAQMLPKFQGQYGWQQIGGRSGFYQYQIGISVPLFFGPELGFAQSAKINKEIYSQELKQSELELNADYQIKREQYQKWFNSWKYYKEQALPLADEQAEGAVLAYKEGAIDYVTFLQNIRDALRMKIDSWTAFGNYLESRYTLEYYLESNF